MEIVLYILSKFDFLVRTSFHSCKAFELNDMGNIFDYYLHLLLCANFGIIDQ